MLPFTQEGYLKSAKHNCTDQYRCQEICGKMKCMFFGTPEGCRRQEIIGKPCPFAHVRPPHPEDENKKKIHEIMSEIIDILRFLKEDEMSIVLIVVRLNVIKIWGVL